MQQQPDELLSQSRDNESLVATALVTPKCVSTNGGKFRTGIQFFLLYRNEVSYKAKKWGCKNLIITSPYKPY